MLVQPYFLLRLVEHFRDVPAPVRTTALVAIAIGVAAAFLFPGRGFLWSMVLYSYLVVADTYVAIAFSKEARRKAGVTAKRLLFAALGTWLFASVFAVHIGGNLRPQRGSRSVLRPPPSSFPPR